MASTPWQTSGNDVYYDAGNVGIKTSVPGADLEVGGNGDVILNDAGSNNPNVIFRTNGVEEGRVWSGVSSGTLRLRAGGSLSQQLVLADNGMVGIGTIPSYDLHVVSNTGGDSKLVLEESTSGNRFTAWQGTGSAVIGTETNANLQIRTNNQERIRVTSGGNVGIGEPNPVHKLDVAGSFQADDGNFGGTVDTTVLQADAATVNGRITMIEPGANWAGQLFVWPNSGCNGQGASAACHDAGLGTRCLCWRGST